MGRSESSFPPPYARRVSPLPKGSGVVDCAGQPTKGQQPRHASTGLTTHPPARTVGQRSAPTTQARRSTPAPAPTAGRAPATPATVAAARATPPAPPSTGAWTSSALPAARRCAPLGPQSRSGLTLVLTRRRVAAPPASRRGALATRPRGSCSSRGIPVSSSPPCRPTSVLCLGERKHDAVPAGLR